MARFACLAAALCLLAMACSANAYKRGKGTAYFGAYDKDATGKNSCQYGKLDDRWERFYAALPSSSFNKSEDCGRCLKARGTESDAPGDWIVVKVVDECASCNGDGEANDVDFSTDALKAITGYGWDRKGIEWEWTSCDTKDSKSDDDESGKDSFNDGDKDKDSSKDKEEDDGDKKKKKSSDRRLLRA